MTASRRERWGGEEIPTHLRLVDDDLDQLEHAVQLVDERLGKIVWILVGMLISLATGSVLLAANLLVAR